MQASCENRARSGSICGALTMLNRLPSKSMIMLLPLLAACSESDGGSPASAPTLDTAIAAQGIAQPAAGTKTLTDYDIWSARLMANRTSPVVAAAGDLTENWIGADGILANVVVRAPRTSGKPTVSVSPPANGGDATPVFQAAFTQLRSSAGGTLKVLPGEYHFKTGRQTEQAGLANLLISKLNDVEIDATGAKFLFEAGCDGVFIEDSRRIRLRGAVMEDPSELSGYGRMKLVDGTTRLILDKPLPAGLSINWVQAMNEGADRSWPQIQAKAIIPPTDPQAVRIDDRTFTAPGFKALADGQMVSVKYTWYGKRAIFIRDTNKGFSEDVIFDGVNIGSVGGIAVMLKTRGRGFAVVNSTLSASTGRPYSSNYDGLHVISAGGDILIRNNAFAHTGDDLVNLRSIIHKVSNIKPNSVTLSNDARMMRVGDEVAFFTATGEYIGRRMISSAPPLGNSDTIAFGLAAGEPINEAVYARDINITPRRFAVVNNTMANSSGRGMLIQVPNGLLKGNTFRNVPWVAIRMMTSYNPWLEGAGAINVRVTANTFENGGATLGLNYATGIITVLGEVTQLKIPTNIHNGPIKIDSNKFVKARSACITIYNAKATTEEANTCSS